jgi:hypothetical protein
MPAIFLTTGKIFLRHPMQILKKYTMQALPTGASILWQAGWDYGQGLKASRELEPAPLKPEDIDPFFPIEQL